MILLTGATGKVGSELVAVLRGAGAEFKVMARDPMKAAAVLGGVSAVAGDFDRKETLAGALEGADAAFLLPPTDPKQPAWERSFVEAAAKAGVKRVVKLSVAGVAMDSPVRIGRWHFEGEAALKSSGMEWTMVQPSFFHQNFLGSADAIGGGAVYGAMGAEKVSMVDTRDIAAVSAAALTKPGHAGKSYLLATGAYTYAEVAEVFSRELGRKVVYNELSAEAMKQALLKAGLPEWYADALGELFAAVRAGCVGQTSNDCERILGRGPVTLPQFVAESKKAFS